MGVQFLEIGGQRMAVLPVSDYERLVELAEDKADVAAAIRAEERRKDGEEYLPAEFVDRLLAGEPPVRLWRVYRGLSQSDVASRMGVTVATVSRMESGKLMSSPAKWRLLANALNVAVEDILPE